MRVTLWVNEEREETIELGGFFPAYEAIAEMEKAAGGAQDWSEEWPALSQVKQVAGDNRDADPSWLRDVSVEAQAFLDVHGDKLSEGAREILRKLSDQ